MYYIIFVIKILNHSLYLAWLSGIAPQSSESSYPFTTEVVFKHYTKEFLYFLNTCIRDSIWEAGFVFAALATNYWIPNTSAVAHPKWFAMFGNLAEVPWFQEVSTHQLCDGSDRKRPVEGILFTSPAGLISHRHASQWVRCTLRFLLTSQTFFFPRTSPPSFLQKDPTNCIPKDDMSPEAIFFRHGLK